MDSFGQQLRTQRRRLGLTLDELARRTQISKPYLSLIETGRVANPPSDAKLRRLEQALQFAPGHLVSQAHWLKTPPDVRAALQGWIAGAQPPANASADRPVDLDQAYLRGMLHELADRRGGNLEPNPLDSKGLPVINKVAAGYPTDFTDLDYPQGVADEYIPNPGLPDPNVFAARVIGDSMSPDYQEGDIVLFSPAAQPKSGDDCLIRFADAQTTFKQVVFEENESEGRFVRLQPRNPNYRTQRIPSEEITGIYKAVFKYQRLNGA